MIRFIAMFRRFGSIVRGLWRRFLTGRRDPLSDYGRAYETLVDTMRRADTWDGRRLRAQMLSDFDMLGIGNATIETINPSATFLRIVRPSNPRRAVVLHYTLPEPIGTSALSDYGWTALVDDFTADNWSRCIQYGAENVADEIAAFLVAA